MLSLQNFIVKELDPHDDLRICPSHLHKDAVEYVQVLAFLRFRVMIIFSTFYSVALLVLTYASHKSYES